MRISIITVSALYLSFLSSVGVAACSGAHSEPALEPSEAFSFHMVRAESKSEVAMRLAAEGKVPPGSIYRPFANKEGGLILEKRSQFTIDCVDNAEVDDHPAHDKAVLNFEFNEECTRAFADVTANSIGRQFAVLIYGEIVTAPTIHSAITTGTGFIEGGMSETDMQKIADEINTASKRRDEN